MMKLIPTSELFSSRKPTIEESQLDAVTADDILIATGRVNSVDGVRTCAGRLDGVGKAFMRIKLGGEPQSLPEAYSGELSSSILETLRLAVADKLAKQGAPG
jgi:hypothetical protein